MILLDYSQVIFGQVHMDLARNKGTISPDLIRHLVLNQIGTLNTKFRDQYGRMVICIDSFTGQYWRKQFFEYYKWKRKEDRKKSDIDWDTLFPVMDQIRSEVIEQVPLLTLEVEGYEADDLIAILAQEFRNEKTLIISSDGDFKQLQRYSHISQWSPQTRKFVKCDDPDFYRFEHIIRGDAGDGIPNIYSPRDFFPRKAEGELSRQKSVFSDKVEEMWKACRQGATIDGLLTEEEAERFRENKTLVDLVETNPEWSVHDEVIEAFFEAIEKHNNTRFNLYGYMMKNRLRRLMENLEEFQGRGEWPKPKGTQGLEPFTFT